MSSPGILTPSATRALLDRLGLRPKRQLGQNFLVDGNIVRKSLELAQITAGDRVVEVGPGLGTLTAALMEAGADVFAVERDAALAAYLRESLVDSFGGRVSGAPHAHDDLRGASETRPPGFQQGRLHLLEGDAVEHPLGPLSADVVAERGRDFKIVANLPYAISSPWMEAVLSGPLPERMVLMLQLEAAQRYGAQPGSKSFGAISVFLQAAYRVAPGHRVSRTCFFPQPDVDSTLLNLERLEAPVSFSSAGRALVRTIFQQRRKQLAPLVRRAAPEAAARWLPWLAASGVRVDARAEDVPVAAWVELDRCGIALGPQ